jgi:hypothetical protein
MQTKMRGITNWTSATFLLEKIKEAGARRRTGKALACRNSPAYTARKLGTRETSRVCVVLPGMARLRSPRLLGCLLALVLVHVASAQGPAEVVEEELTEDQLQYYRDIFQQYDEDADQRISMEENLEQDKIIAEEQQKPFDEVS